jgi:hypothetical protein
MFIITAVGFVLPLTIIIFCYSRILAIMNSSGDKINRFQDGKIKQEAVDGTPDISKISRLTTTGIKIDFAFLSV